MFDSATIARVRAHHSPVIAGQVHNVPPRVALAIQTNELSTAEVLAATDTDSLIALANEANARHNAARICGPACSACVTTN